MSASERGLPGATSEHTAESGCVFVSGPGGDDHVLSEAKAWREDGVYVLRSTEFDVIAEDEDFDRAIDAFVTWLIDHAALLAEMVQAGKATSDEAQAFALLAARGILRRWRFLSPSSGTMCKSR